MSTTTPHPSTGHRNEVLLVGRIESSATERVLPSGDQVVSWRLGVQRLPEAERRTVGVDSVDCVAGGAGLGRRALSWRPGDTMEVTGSIRRRFWRGADGVRSRCEVEVIRARRIGRAPVPAVAPAPGPGETAPAGGVTDLDTSTDHDSSA